MASYKSKAIILKRRNMGESDRVLTLFSLEFGKITAIAKGARKSKSKLSGGVELFTEADFVLTKGKSFEIINEVSVVSHHLSAEKDLETIKLAHFFAEVVCHITVEHQPSKIIYETLSYCLSCIGRVDNKILVIYFTSKILEVTGSYPELSVCLGCQNKPENDIFFSHSAGGIFCYECRPVTESIFIIDRDTVKLWRFIMESTTSDIERLKITNQQLLEGASTTALNFLCNITGKDYCTLTGFKLTKRNS